MVVRLHDIVLRIDLGYSLPISFDVQITFHIDPMKLPKFYTKYATDLDSFKNGFLRNYVHVRDVAKAFLHLINNYETYNNNAFNVGLTSANMSKLQLAQKIKEYVPNLVIIEEQFKEDFDKRNYIVSNAKIESRGFKPMFTLDYGIKQLIEAYPIIITNNNRSFTNLWAKENIYIP